MSIINRAEKLGEAIVETSEYDKLKTTEEAMYNNPDAKEILTKFQNKQNEMHKLHHQGGEITAEMQEEVQDLQQQLEENEIVKKYLDAQQEFNQLMEKVNQTLSEKIYGPQDGCGSDCGGGCC